MSLLIAGVAVCLVWRRVRSILWTVAAVVVALLILDALDPDTLHDAIEPIGLLLRGVFFRDA